MRTGQRRTRRRSNPWTRRIDIPGGKSRIRFESGTVPKNLPLQSMYDVREFPFYTSDRDGRRPVWTVIGEWPALREGAIHRVRRGV